MWKGQTFPVGLR